MKTSFDEYAKQIEQFYLNKKGVFTFLSAKEMDLIRKWYKKKIPVEKIKSVIEKEIAKFPERKRKKFSLLIIDKILQESLKAKQESSLTKWEKVIKTFNIPKDKLLKAKSEIETEKLIVKHIWDNLPLEDKQKLVNEAKEHLRGNKLSKREFEDEVKAYIYTKIVNYINLL